MKIASAPGHVDEPGHVRRRVAGPCGPIAGLVSLLAVAADVLRAAVGGVVDSVACPAVGSCLITASFTDASRDSPGLIESQNSPAPR